MGLKIKKKTKSIKKKLNKESKQESKNKYRSRKHLKTRKIKGGFFNISEKLDSIKESVKNRFINILLHGQTPIVQEKIRNVIENDKRFKKFNIKIDLFIDRVETLIQKIVQTITTTTIKVTTAWVPGVSFIGAILTTVINWAVIYVKILARGYDLYNVYNEMKVIIEEQGGQAVDVSSKIGNLQKHAIQKVANATVPQHLANVAP